ncbi:MAG: lipoprotein-releasing ABC transporter permease subunit [Gammaproteobacteria bacterium]|nr:MAG: lipoprotein-releasing ABC transporter permease subunit [Gammaproteobacteria bacterium]
MFKPLAVYIGLRYTRAKRKNHFISFISFVSMGGIALGVMVLITVMSVMNGFERELKDRILGMTPHVMIGERRGVMTDWQSVASLVAQSPQVVATAPYIQTQGVLRAGGDNVFVFVQGVLPEREAQVSIVGKHMLEGKLSDLHAGGWQIILGRDLARRLGVYVGDKVTLLVVEGTTVSPTGIIPRFRKFTVAGIFEVRAEMDASLAIIHIADGQKLLRTGDGVHGVRLKLADVMQASRVSKSLRQILGFRYYVSDWTYTQGSLFRAVKMEKNMMFLLLAFIIAVAAFNIVSTMVMVVTDKQADIAILKTFGATPSLILRVFAFQGAFNGIIGTVLGVVGGVVLSLNLPDFAAWLEHAFGITLLPGDVYFINFLPSELQWSDVGRVAGAALLMAFLATIYPAWRASRTKPVEALRYE